MTGRTHQIRLHLAFLGCPVVGDTVYGRRKPTLPVGRQMLHAWRLRLTLPGEAEARGFEAPLPEDFAGALDRLRQAARKRWATAAHSQPGSRPGVRRGWRTPG